MQISDNFFFDFLLNSNGHPVETLKENQAIIDQCQAAFANDYPGVAYFVDKISLVTLMMICKPLNLRHSKGFYSNIGIGNASQSRVTVIKHCVKE